MQLDAVLLPHGNRIASHGMPARQAPAAAKPDGRLPGLSHETQRNETPR